MAFDCGFTKEDNWFRYRAAAIMIEDGCILVVGNDKENYFYSVGGGVHMNEKAEDAVVREVMGETGVRYQIDRLAIIHENFWNGDGAYDKGLHCHEIALYYLMKPRGTKELNSNSLTHFNDRETMHWIPIKEIDYYTIYPHFSKIIFFQTTQVSSILLQMKESNDLFIKQAKNDKEYKYDNS